MGIRLGEIQLLLGITWNNITNIYWEQKRSFGVEKTGSGLEKGEKPIYGSNPEKKTSMTPEFDVSTIMIAYQGCPIAS